MDHRPIVPVRLPLNAPAPPNPPLAEAAAYETVYYNGPILELGVYTVFWGYAWEVEPFSSQRAQLNQFIAELLTGPYRYLIQEYTGYDLRTPGSLWGSSVLLDPPPPLFGSVDDTTIGANILDWVVFGQVPLLPAKNSLFGDQGPAGSQARGLYFIFVPPWVQVTLDGEGSCDVPLGFCGYHKNLENIAYAVVPYIECSGCDFSGGPVLDNLTKVISHELAEGITDPLPPSGPPEPIEPPSVGWFPEIGDPCNFNLFRLAGTRTPGQYWMVQSLFSESRGTCFPVPVLKTCEWAAPQTWQDVIVLTIEADGSVASRIWTEPQGWGNYDSLRSVTGPDTAQPGSLVYLPRWPFKQDLFWVGPDSSVLWDQWTNNLMVDGLNLYGENPPGTVNPPNSWSDGTTPSIKQVSQIPSAASATPATLAAVSVWPWIADVFWIGPDGAVYVSRMVDDQALFGPGTQLSPPGTAAPGALTAVVGTPLNAYSFARIDVFWIGTDGQIVTTWWDELIGWNPIGPLDITPAGVAQPGALTAQAPSATSAEVFWISPNDRVCTTNRNASWQWSPVTVIAEDSPAQPAILASTSRFGGRVDLFWVGPALEIMSATSNSAADGWTASDIGIIPGDPPPEFIRLAAVGRTQGNQEVIWQTDTQLCLIEGSQAGTNDPVNWAEPAVWQ